MKQTVAKHDHTKVTEFMVPGENINQDEVIAMLISVVFTLAAFPLACLVFWSIIRCHKGDKQEFVFFNALQISGLSMTFSVF